ncbi:HigA family addiction module antitoxin [Brevundimonas sp. SL130]|uniref:HigA family addiction module antitoxin n=1 Tax=Brevundimonas sp. SL130 TaxID=2995143 RepID=UPI00226CEE51|nr:HigA family addiction module antitoxin [Brevundimonas sp. SL130]WAC61472.1 HigA family addiction module antitoxin [Brevundimonas sp. SL130]
MNYFTLNDPVHPGELIKEDILPHFQWTIGQAAKHLGIARPNLSNVLNGKTALTVDLALQLESAFGVDAEMLTQMMTTYAIKKAKADPDRKLADRVPEPA